MSVSLRRVEPTTKPIRLAYLRARSAAESTSRKFQPGGPAPRSSDEFWLLAQWSRSEQSLHFHSESLISWAPIEMLGMPTPVEDETGQRWMLCKFRYFGSRAERDRLIASARARLDGLTRWEAIRSIGLD